MCAGAREIVDNLRNGLIVDPMVRARAHASAWRHDTAWHGMAQDAHAIATAIASLLFDDNAWDTAATAGLERFGCTAFE